MLPILSLLGVALVAALWPDSQSPSDDLTETRDEVEADGPRADVATIMEASEVATEDEDHQDDLIPAGYDALLDGGTGDDILVGGAADDVISGGDGEDTLDGGFGDDLLIGNDDADGDTLIGGDGNDRIWAGPEDVAWGGFGDDEFLIDSDVSAPVHIADYNPDDDKIEVHYDPTGDKPTLEARQGEDGVFTLLADGDVVATFSGITHFDLSRVYLKADAA